MNVPQELIQAYSEIVRNAGTAEEGAAHLLNFLLDAEKIRETIAQAIADAKVRAGQ